MIEWLGEGVGERGITRRSIGRNRSDVRRHDKETQDSEKVRQEASARLGAGVGIAVDARGRGGGVLLLLGTGEGTGG